MPLVNLIQEQRLAVRQREQQTRVLFLGILGIAALSFLTAGYFTFDSIRLKAQAANIEQKIEELKPVTAELAMVEDQITQLTPRMKTLEDAQHNTQQWMDVLGYLTTNTPDTVLLNGLKTSQSDSADPIQVSLTGLSKTQEAVGAFILRIEASPEMEQTMLRYTQERSSGSGADGAKATQFEVVTSLAGTGEKPKAVNEEGE